MREINLPKSQRARLWFGELPVEFTGKALVEENIETLNASLNQSVKLAVEMLVPTGARFLYGLLGAELRPNKAGHIRVQLISSPVNNSHYKNSLADKLDEVFIGLPQEYMGSVLQGIISSNSEFPMPAGNLIVNCAAHGAVGSCELIFKHLGKTVAQLLAKETILYEASDEQLFGLLKL